MSSLLKNSNYNVAINAEQELEKYPKAKITTYHTIHGGVYTRTIRLNAGEALVGACIKVPTTLIIEGHLLLNSDDNVEELVGYHVIPASANRKQVMFAKESSVVTMIMRTENKNVKDIEKEFTDDWDRLVSNEYDNVEIITGV